MSPPLRRLRLAFSWMAGPGLILNDVPLQLHAGANNVGLTYVWEEAARPVISSGELRTVLEDWAPPASRLLLYYPGDRRVPPALRAFIDVMRSVHA